MPSADSGWVAARVPYNAPPVSEGEHCLSPLGLLGARVDE